MKTACLFVQIVLLMNQIIESKSAWIVATHTHVQFNEPNTSTIIIPIYSVLYPLYGFWLGQPIWTFVMFPNRH